MKKVLCLTIAAVMALSVAPAYAEADITDENVVYQVNRDADGNMNVAVDKTTQALTFTEPLPDNAIRVVVDNKELVAHGVSVDGRTLVPLRALGEALGAAVNWDADKQEIRIEKLLYQSDSHGNVTESNRIILMNIGSKQSQENGVANDLDVPPQIIGGSTMVPARAITDFLEATIAWDEASRTVAIQSALTDSPQGAQWEQQDLAIGVANATSEYVKKVNEEAQDEKEKYRAENRPKGDMEAWGFKVSWLSINKNPESPSYGVKFLINKSGYYADEASNLETASFRLSVVDKASGKEVYNTSFKYVDVAEHGDYKKLNLPQQYLDDDQYDYTFSVLV